MSLEGQSIGRYHLQRLLGSGGMGEVYLASDNLINRQVAIKAIKAEATPYADSAAVQEAARLFQREMKAIATLDHPHILPLFDYGESQLSETTLTYMVMPYRSEGSLTNWLRGRGSANLLAPQEVSSLLTQAASALQHAHNRQIIHQDVKPANFLIRLDEEHPGRPHLLLADFGVARFTSATTSASQTIRGTPGYMAPEQWEGHPLPATDQYALAVMAYELLTGRQPFQGSLSQLMYQHFHTAPAPPSTLNPRLSARVDNVLLQALAKMPQERFASISVFARALQEAVESPPASPDAMVSGAEIHATLAISANEALKGRAVLLIVLTLLLLASGLGLFSLIHANQVATTIATATRMAQPQATVIVANPYGSGGRLALSDPLRNNTNGHGWDEGSTGSVSCIFTGGAYHVSIPNASSFGLCIARSPDFDNFTFEVQMRIIKGDIGGVVFRDRGTNGATYVFGVGATGIYDVALCSPGNPCNELVATTSSSAIKQGLNRTNTLAVVAKGSSITVYANHQQLASFKDSTYTHGQIGMIASPLATNGHATEVVYSHAKVWTF